MSMNKRLLAVALMFSLFMSLAACSNQEAPSNGTPESGAKGEVSDISVQNVKTKLQKIIKSF